MLDSDWSESLDLFSITYLVTFVLHSKETFIISVWNEYPVLVLSATIRSEVGTGDCFRKSGSSWSKKDLRSDIYLDINFTFV